MLNKDCEDCMSYELKITKEICPKSQKECGHHCDHSWTHDICCWCGKEWGEQSDVLDNNRRV